MKERLDRVSIPNFDKVIREALRKSGLTPKDIKVLLPLHTKRSMLIELIQGASRRTSCIFRSLWTYVSA